MHNWNFVYLQVFCLFQLYLHLLSHEFYSSNKKVKNRIFWRNLLCYFKEFADHFGFNFIDFSLIFLQMFENELNDRFEFGESIGISLENFFQIEWIFNRLRLNSDCLLSRAILIFICFHCLCSGHKCCHSFLFILGKFI